MQKLKVPLAASRGSQRGSGTGTEVARTVSYSRSTLPEIINRSTDVELPRSVWSSWIEEGKPRQLRRALTEPEVNALVARRNELEPAVAGYESRERDRVVLAIADMLGGFASRHGADEAVVGRLDSMMRLLASFPAWAIEKVCNDVHLNGYHRDGKIERVWPPSDAELVALIREEVKIFERHLQSANFLLAATVEKAAAVSLEQEKTP
jgi:hypothetical protein